MDILAKAAIALMSTVLIGVFSLIVVMLKKGNGKSHSTGGCSIEPPCKDLRELQTAYTAFSSAVGVKLDAITEHCKALQSHLQAIDAKADSRYQERR